MDLGVRRIQVQVYTLQFDRCITLVKLFNFSESQFPPPQNGSISRTDLLSLIGEVRSLLHGELLTQWSVHVKNSLRGSYYYFYVLSILQGTLQLHFLI